MKWQVTLKNKTSSFCIEIDDETLSKANTYVMTGLIRLPSILEPKITIELAPNEAGNKEQIKHTWSGVRACMGAFDLLYKNGWLDNSNIDDDALIKEIWRLKILFREAIRQEKIPVQGIDYFSLDVPQDNSPCKVVKKTDEDNKKYLLKLYKHNKTHCENDAFYSTCLQLLVPTQAPRVSAVYRGENAGTLNEIKPHFFSMENFRHHHQLDKIPSELLLTGKMGYIISAEDAIGIGNSGNYGFEVAPQSKVDFVGNTYFIIDATIKCVKYRGDDVIPSHDPNILSHCALLFSHHEYLYQRYFIMTKTFSLGDTAYQKIADATITSKEEKVCLLNQLKCHIQKLRCAYLDDSDYLDYVINNQHWILPQIIEEVQDYNNLQKQDELETLRVNSEQIETNFKLFVSVCIASQRSMFPYSGLITFTVPDWSLPVIPFFNQDYTIPAPINYAQIGRGDSSNVIQNSMDVYKQPLSLSETTATPRLFNSTAKRKIDDGVNKIEEANKTIRDMLNLLSNLDNTKNDQQTNESLTKIIDKFAKFVKDNEQQRSDLLKYFTSLNDIFYQVGMSLITENLDPEIVQTITQHRYNIEEILKNSNSSSKPRLK